MIIKNGTKLNGIVVDSTSILSKGRVVPNIKITPTCITVHNTSNPNATAENHRKFLIDHNKANATGAMTSWHFTVDDTKIAQHLDTAQLGYHAGTTVGNKSSIGMEVTEFTDKKKQAKAIENAKVLVRYLMNQHKIAIGKVYTHKKWTGKNCPRVIMAENGGFEEFLATVPKTITVNGATEVATVAKVESKTSTSVATANVDKYTFKATDKHIGVVESIYAGDVNIREKADLTSKVVATSKVGQGWKVTAITNGLYKIGANSYITSNAKYVKYFDNPYLDNSGKAMASTATSTVVTKAVAVTERLKVKVDNLFVYNSADWNDKGSSVNKDDVFTVVKELTVQGAKMYQLKSGLFITASTKYVEII